MVLKLLCPKCGATLVASIRSDRELICPMCLAKFRVVSIWYDSTTSSGITSVTGNAYEPFDC